MRRLRRCGRIDHLEELLNDEPSLPAIVPALAVTAPIARVPGSRIVPVLKAPPIAPVLTPPVLTAMVLASGMILMLAVLLTAGSPLRVGPVVQAPTFLTPSDTINGERITDQGLVQRIERIAAGVPSNLLAAHSRATPVRYLAQGFGAGDDAAVFHGVFRDPAAALAFGCALDVDIGDRCDTMPVDNATTAYEELPGISCVPMRFALGAPAFEPDRCEAGG